MSKSKKGIFARIGDWFRGMRSELKKVVWPTRKQTINNSLVVLTVVAFVAVLIWGFDFVASSIVELLITLFA